MKKPDMYLRKQPNSYAQRYKQERRRRKRSKEKPSRQLLGSEEDLVKTGSEDEDGLDLEKQLELARKARPKRAERITQMKEEVINSRHQHNHVSHNKENQQDIYRQRNRTADHNNQLYQNSLTPSSNKSYPLRRLPNQSLVYPSRAKSGEIHFSPKFFDMYQVQQNDNFNYDEVPQTQSTHNDRNVETGSGAANFEHVREEARSKRSSILNRAEKLIEHISRSDRYSSDDDNRKDTTGHVKHRRKTQTKYLQTKEMSSSSDDEKYVLVKTTVSPEPVDTDKNNVGSDLPRFIQAAGHKSTNSVHSMEKVRHFLIIPDFVILSWYSIF
jgi:hypothetical protein